MVNPAARTDKASPIFGMPILNVDHAKNVQVIKRGKGVGVRLGIKTTGHLCGLGRSKAIQAIYIQHVLRVLSLED